MVLDFAFSSTTAMAEEISGGAAISLSLVGGHGDQRCSLAVICTIPKKLDTVPTLGGGHQSGGLMTVELVTLC